MRASSVIKKGVSIVLSIILFSNVCMADSVYIASSPANSLNSGNGVVSSNVVYGSTANDVYSGPNSIPSEGTVVSLTNSSTGTAQQAGQGVVYQNPKATVISSPAAYYRNQQENVESGQTSTVINNYNLVNDSGERVTYQDPVAFDNPGPGRYDGQQTSDNNGPGANNTVSQEIPSTGENQIEQIDMGYNTNDIMTSYVTNNNIVTARPKVSAPSAIVVNATTKEIYYFKDPFTGYTPAGLANLMTAYLLLQYKQLTDVLTVSARAVNNLEEGATTAGLRAGDVITVSDAIAAMFIKSCCDVSNCVAENVGGSIENFVTMMNQTAKSMGMVSTNFTNPSGLNNDAQKISSYDMAILLDKVSDNASLAYLMTLSSYTLPATAHRGALLLTTKNSIIIPGSSRHYSGIAGSRMGYTSKALYTMASYTMYNGQKLIAVVMKANGSQFSDTTKMLDFAKKASVESVAGAQMAQTAMANQDLAALQAAQINQQATSQMAAAQAAQVAAAQAAQVAAAQATQMSMSQASAAGSNVQGETLGAWQQDATGGWMFILATGQKAINQWIQNNGKIYYMDGNGYMITGLRQFSNGNSYYFDTTTGELRYNTWINLSTGAYYLQADGSIAKAAQGTLTNITTPVGVYTINDTGRAVAKVS